MEHSSFRFRALSLIGAAVVLFFSVQTLRAQSSSTFKRGALVEEFTGIWCPHCPPGTWALDTLEKKYGDHLVVIAWHGGPALPGDNSYEDLWIPPHDSLFSFFALTGWPEAPLNRAQSGGFGINGYPRYQLETQVGTSITTAPTVDYRIVNATYTSSTKTVDFDVDVTPYDMTKMFSDDTTRYATLAVLTEDNVLESQANAGDWTLVTDNPIDNFPEMNVARLVSGNAILGDAFTLGTKTPGSTLPVRIHYSMKVDNAWNDANIKVKSFVEATYPKNSKKITPVIFDAKQTMYVNQLPLLPPDAAWIVLPNANTVVKSGVATNIVWATGGSVGNNVKLEYSADTGKTWNLIVASTTQSPYPWTIPSSAYGPSIVIRVSAGNMTGVSDLVKTPGVINIIKPAAGEVITGGTDYTVTFSGGNLKAPLTFFYSTDNGTNWTSFGQVNNAELTQYTWYGVPNPPADAPQSIVKITDANGVTKQSGLFTIKSVASTKGKLANAFLVGLTNNEIDPNRNLAVSFVATGDIGGTVTAYLSTDGGTTWTLQTLAYLKDSSLAFKTPNTGVHPNSMVKLQSSGDATISILAVDPNNNNSTSFAIGKTAGVDGSAPLGYSLSNYPNPVTGQTTISFKIPVSMSVTLNVLDNLGRVVDHQVTKVLDAGEHQIPFNVTELSGGVYTYTLEAGSVRLAGKMTVVK